MVEADNEALKREVQEYWNAHPCGTQFTHLEWGSKAFFDEVERFRYTSQPFMKETAEFNHFPGKRLLEIGCGLGTDLLQFARGGALVTGVDLTPRSIELVKQRFALYGLPVDARVADAEQLPFEDNSFDIVYSFGVLHHTPNTPKAINEVYRVLKPGGKIIIMLYHQSSMHVALGSLYRRLSGKAPKEGDRTDDWVRIYDGEDNPLGKAYTRNQVRRMFSQYSNLHLSTVDPYRYHLPVFANTINQALLAWWWGFWLMIKGTKQ
ncbi:MAG: class I SAM-dependent methyltransferase [bacterium]